jgi:hypothetical protein
VPNSRRLLRRGHCFCLLAQGSVIGADIVVGWVGLEHVGTSPSRAARPRARATTKVQRRQDCIEWMCLRGQIYFRPVECLPLSLAETKGTCRRTQRKTLFRQVSTSSHRSTEQLTASRTEMRSNADFPPTENGISFAKPKSSVTRIPRPLVTEPRRVVYDKVLFTSGDCCFVRVSVFRG